MEDPFLFLLHLLSYRGVIFQVRVLRRMVEVGFLNVDMALKIVNQSVHLSPEGPKSADGLSNSFCSYEEVSEFCSFIVLKF